MNPLKEIPDTEYNIERILFDYKQLMMISDMFNGSVAYKTLFLHLCGGSQFVSDVFAATHGKLEIFEKTKLRRKW